MHLLALIKRIEKVTGKNLKFSIGEFKQLQALRADVEHIDAMLRYSKSTKETCFLLNHYKEDARRKLKWMSMIEKKMNIGIKQLENLLTSEENKIPSKEKPRIEQFKKQMELCKNNLVRILSWEGELHKLIKEKVDWKAIKAKIDEAIGTKAKPGIGNLMAVLTQLEKDNSSFISWEDFVKNKVVKIKSKNKYALHNTTMSGFHNLISRKGFHGMDEHCMIIPSFKLGSIFGSWRKKPTESKGPRTLKELMEIQRQILEKDNIVKGIEINYRILSPPEFAFLRKNFIREGQTIKEINKRTLVILERAHLFFGSLYTNAILGVIIPLNYVTHRGSYESFGVFTRNTIIGVVLFNTAKKNLEEIKEIMFNEFKGNLSLCFPIYDTYGRVLWPE
tara:strand:+ start:290 stop:1462 length:1173 start_codon:yes stop_codon:yes gene_type:complete